MRLLLDEQYSPVIAQQLCEGGFDVTAVRRQGLQGTHDEPLLQIAADQGRALLTNNVRDFAPLAAQWAAQGHHHFGLIFTSEASMPRSRNTIGLYVEKLGELLENNPAHDAYRTRVGWLR